MYETAAAHLTPVLDVPKVSKDTCEKLKHFGVDIRNILNDKCVFVNDMNEVLANIEMTQFAAEETIPAIIENSNKKDKRNE